MRNYKKNVFQLLRPCTYATHNNYYCSLKVFVHATENKRLIKLFKCVIMMLLQMQKTKAHNLQEIK